MESPELLSILTHYLCPPGDGVFTVSTAREHREVIQRMLYGGIGEHAQKGWRKTLDSLAKNKAPIILGIPSDNGGGIQRGANWGPLFVRKHLYPRLDAKKICDVGDVRVIPQLLLDDYIRKSQLKLCRKAQYGDENSALAVSPLSITRAVSDLLLNNFSDKKILGLGGDHSVSYPLVKSYLAAKKNQKRRVALVHFDAHTDLLPKRQGLDITFGSWVSHIIKDLVSPAHLVQIGIRATGRDKNYWEKSLGIKQYWAKELNENSPKQIIGDLLHYLEKLKLDEIYITFDIDCIDQRFAAATGTPEPDGISPDYAMEMCRSLGAQYAVSGADLVEVAPNVRWSDSNGEEPARTLNVAASIAATLWQLLV